MSKPQLPSFPEIELETVKLGPGLGGGYVVEVMDTRQGKGRMIPSLYAEEEARAVLKVIARHKAKLRRDKRKKENS